MAEYGCDDYGKLVGDVGHLPAWQWTYPDIWDANVPDSVLEQQCGFKPRFDFEVKDLGEYWGKLQVMKLGMFNPVNDAVRRSYNDCHEYRLTYHNGPNCDTRSRSAHPTYQWDHWTRSVPGAAVWALLGLFPNTVEDGEDWDR